MQRVWPGLERPQCAVRWTYPLPTTRRRPKTPDSPDKVETEHAETKHLERAPAGGAVRPSCSEPGLKAYTHGSDQFGPFATQTIPAAVSEAPYILDGLLITKTGRRIPEQYADCGGFTDHVFAVTSLLGYRFVPRIRDLPPKRLHVFETRRVPKPFIGLTCTKVREDVIVRNWPDILGGGCHPGQWRPYPPAHCCESSRPIPASTNRPSLCAKSDGSNAPSLSSTACWMPICSAGPEPALTGTRLITPS